MNSKDLRLLIHQEKFLMLPDSEARDFLAKFEEMKKDPRKYSFPKSLILLTLTNQVPDDVLNWTP